MEEWDQQILKLKINMENEWKKNYSRYKEFFLNIWRLYNTKPSLKIYLELILSLSTITIFALFAIKPTILTIIELNKEIVTKQETISKLRQKIKNLQTANLILQDENLTPQIIDDAIPDDAATETLVKQIELLSSQNSVQILSLSVSDVNILGKNDVRKKSTKTINLPEGSNELEFTFSVTGSYINLINLLKALETLRRPIKIDSFLINANISSGSKILTLTISGRVPFFNHEKN